MRFLGPFSALVLLALLYDVHVVDWQSTLQECLECQLYAESAKVVDRGQGTALLRIATVPAGRGWLVVYAQAKRFEE